MRYRANWICLAFPFSARKKNSESLGTCLGPQPQAIINFLFSPINKQPSENCKDCIWIYSKAAYLSFVILPPLSRITKLLLGCWGCGWCAVGRGEMCTHGCYQLCKALTSEVWAYLSSWLTMVGRSHRMIGDGWQGIKLCSLCLKE